MDANSQQANAKVEQVGERLKNVSVSEKKDGQPKRGGGGGGGGSGHHNKNHHNRQRRNTSGTDQVQDGGKPRSQSQTKTQGQGGAGGSRNNSQARSRNNSQKALKEETDTSGESKSVSKDKRRTRSTNSNNGKAQGQGQQQQARQSKQSTRTISQTSNGDGYYCSDAYEDLDEPFSDSDDDIPRVPQKPNLHIPRGRIRTLSGTVPVVGFSPKWGGPTMCLSCLQFFDLPDQVESFTEHLLKEHKIVVREMELIVDPKRYVEHWRQRFAKDSVDKIFPKIVPKEGEPHFGEADYYYEMSEQLQEDYSLRQTLAMRRLEEALSCQQREREDTHFSLQCIFCRYTARGNRSKIIHHLYMIHHLNLGSPDNLVFVTEYIEHLKEKLVRNECIYCEKTFADRNILMDHMRKRNHREVNPKNHYYDKFYIINYLELGKRWLDVLGEDFEDTTTAFQESDDEEEEDSWCEWQEDNLDIDEHRVVCLLCDHSTENAETLLEHMKEKHEFDLVTLIRDAKLETYQRMKLINYIRKQNFNAVCWKCGKADNGNLIGLHKHLEESEKPIKALPDRSMWDTEEFLVPIFGNDHFLWMLEGLFDESSSDEEEELNRRDPAKIREVFIKKSKKHTVQGVVAEEMPALNEVPELEELF